MRMLSSLHASLLANNHSFCEMRSPSLCGNRRNFGCRQEGLRRLGPTLFGAFAFDNAVSTSELRAMQRVWEARA